MNIVKQEQEPPTSPSKEGTVCIGIALVGQDIQVAARSGGQEIAHGHFPADSLGTAALLSYLTDWQTPLRLAIATAGAAALGLALTIGVPRGREVFLVAAQSMHSVSDLARYAERAI